MIVLFASIFFKITIVLVFTLSFAGKVRDVSSFQKTIDRFNLTPKWASPFVAFLFLVGELTVILFIIFGGKLLSWGFALAGILLLIFSTALVLVIVRKIDTSCNCFGSSDDERVSKYDVIRNMFFIFCAFVGFFLPVQEWVLSSTIIYIYICAGIIALCSILIVTHLRKIVLLIR